CQTRGLGDRRVATAVACEGDWQRNITIPSPFGIRSTCYTHPWFRVTFNQTLNGEKPFINVNGSDLEVLGSIHSGAILISNPITYINCDKASVSVNLSGTPFFFSSEKNVFGSVGCGNLATISSIEADSLGGCIQPRCDHGASESGVGFFSKKKKKPNEAIEEKKLGIENSAKCN
ncbi:hypothetical protein Godav_014837, partial [Gossypium davidsonii]|nr:hypothetical protein [Gossypium davidsonii]